MAKGRKEGGKVCRKVLMVMSGEREGKNLIRIPYTDLRVLRKPIQDQSNK